jgi:ABC-type multidrug transport system fused ATPase/permease subunit
MNLVVFAVVVTSTTIGTVIAFVMGYLLFRDGLATIGTVFIIVSYTGMMFRPMRELTNQIQELQKAGAGIARITALYHQQSAIQDGPGTPVPAGPLRVEFDHVTFAYYENDIVLDDLTFTLEPGRVLGLLGRTGSGKTTVSRLLFRLYDVTEGAVRLGGVDTRAAHLDDLRQRVGIVTQDVQLFRASVRDNLTFFDRRIPDVRIMEALDDLGLMDWFNGLPQGLDTEIQSGGSGLSAGEAQLLAFTRVFLKDPGLVILDEASSRLDPVTERRIERAIDKLLRDRTAIIIAHRLATVHRADEIMILENGRIREHGARARLAGDRSSRFYQLLQTGLEEALA